MDEEDYEEEEEEDFEDDENSGMILSMGDDGKPKIEMESDYVRVLEKDIKLIQGFLKENKKLFNKYLKKNVRTSIKEDKLK